MFHPKAWNLPEYAMEAEEVTFVGICVTALQWEGGERGQSGAPTRHGSLVAYSPGALVHARVKTPGMFPFRFLFQFALKINK